MNDIIINDAQESEVYVRYSLTEGDYGWIEEETGLSKNDFLDSIKRIKATPDGSLYADIGQNKWFEASLSPLSYTYEEVRKLAVYLQDK